MGFSKQEVLEWGAIAFSSYTPGIQKSKIVFSRLKPRRPQGHALFRGFEENLFYCPFQLLGLHFLAHSAYVHL